MSDPGDDVDPYKRHDYGPLQTFEITWTSGHVERIQAHQVSYPTNSRLMFGGSDDNRPDIIELHGDFDGHWRLQLRTHADRIHTIRNITSTEADLL